MNVQTITMPRGEAAERLRHYRRSLHRRADSEYEAIAKGYEALARGTPLVNVADVIGAAPVDVFGRPRLAIARADRRQVYVTRDWRRPGWFQFQTQLNSMRWPGTLEVGIDMKRDLSKTSSGYAIVPITPPDVRGERDLKRCFVLWEVEQWADRRISSRPDRDPYLLEHLGGDLYAIVGEWNLSELERAVMLGRRDD